MFIGTQRSLLGIALFFAFTAGGCPTFSDADRAAIEASLEAQRQAWNRGDLEAFMAGYAQRPDILFTSGGKVRRGHAQTLEMYRKSYPNKDAMGELAFEVLELQVLGPKGAVMLGRWAVTKTPKEGSGLFTLVWQKTASGWKVIHDHTSAERKPEKATPSE